MNQSVKDIHKMGATAYSKLDPDASAKFLDFDPESNMSFRDGLTNKQNDAVTVSE